LPGPSSPALFSARGFFIARRSRLRSLSTEIGDDAFAEDFQRDQQQKKEAKKERLV
jgi:hypothetical protein